MVLSTSRPKWDLWDPVEQQAHLDQLDLKVWRDLVVTLVTPVHLVPLGHVVSPVHLAHQVQRETLGEMVNQEHKVHLDQRDQPVPQECPACQVRRVIRALLAFLENAESKDLVEK